MHGPTKTEERVGGMDCGKGASIGVGDSGTVLDEGPSDGGAERRERAYRRTRGQLSDDV